jgi:hypothetical protein
VAVTLVVHEHKRLGRGLDLAALAEQLRAAGIALEFLTGQLQGSHEPSGVVFTVLAALSGMEREYVRDRTLEGTNPPAPVARSSAAPPSPTRTCCPWPCACVTRTVVESALWSQPGAAIVVRVESEGRRASRRVVGGREAAEVRISCSPLAGERARRFPVISLTAGIYISCAR